MAEYYMFNKPYDCVCARRDDLYPKYFQRFIRKSRKTPAITARNTQSSLERLQLQKAKSIRFEEC